MPSTLLPRGTLIVDDELRAKAAETVRATGDESVTELTLTTVTGRTIHADPAIVSLFESLVERVAMGGNLSVQTMPETLSTATAAGVLGVSRTTVMKLIRSGELRHSMAGAHHRVALTDALELKVRREEERRANVAALLELDDED